MGVKLTVELGEVHRSNWGAPEDCTLLVKNPATGKQVATVRYVFGETESEPGSCPTSSIGTIRCEADFSDCPGDPIYVAALALRAAYKQCEASDTEFLADIFAIHPTIEFEV